VKELGAHDCDLTQGSAGRSPKELSLGGLTAAHPLKIMKSIDTSRRSTNWGTMTATTPDAATTVRRLLQAFLAGDVETFTSYTDDEIEWNPAQHNPVLTRQYRGREQFMNGAVATVASELDGFRFDIEEVHACGGVAVAELYYHGTVKSTGRPFDVPAAIIWEVRDGKVIRAREYMDTWEAMNAFQPAS